MQHLLFDDGQALLDAGVAVEGVAEHVVDALVHPVFGLAVTLTVEVAVLLGEGDVFVDHGPDLVDADSVIAGVGEHFGEPTRLCRWEEVEGVAEVARGHLGAADVVTVGLVDDDAVSHLHDAALDTLELVARASQLDEQEEVDHRMDGRLALAHADGLDEDGVEACGLTEDDRLARLTGHAT